MSIFSKKGNRIIAGIVAGFVLMGSALVAGKTLWNAYKEYKDSVDTETSETEVVVTPETEPTNQGSSNGNIHGNGGVYVEEERPLDSPSLSPDNNGGNVGSPSDTSAETEVETEPETERQEPSSVDKNNNPVGSPDGEGRVDDKGNTNYNPGTNNNNSNNNSGNVSPDANTPVTPDNDNTNVGTPSADVSKMVAGLNKNLKAYFKSAGVTAEGQFSLTDLVYVKATKSYIEVGALTDNDTMVVLNVGSSANANKVLSTEGDSMMVPAYLSSNSQSILENADVKQVSKIFIVVSADTNKVAVFESVSSAKRKDDYYITVYQDNANNVNVSDLAVGANGKRLNKNQLIQYGTEAVGRSLTK